MKLSRILQEACRDANYTDDEIVEVLEACEAEGFDDPKRMAAELWEIIGNRELERTKKKLEAMKNGHGSQTTSEGPQVAQDGPELQGGQGHHG